MDNKNVVVLADYRANRDAKNVKQDFKRQEMDDRLWFDLGCALKSLKYQPKRESPFK